MVTLSSKKFRVSLKTLKTYTEARATYGIATLVEYVVKPLDVLIGIQ